MAANLRGKSRLSPQQLASSTIECPNFVVGAIGDEPGRVGLAHFSERDLLLALHRSMVAPAPGGETAEKSWSRGGVEP
jgi:hypothetical protein